MFGCGCILDSIISCDRPSDTGHGIGFRFFTDGKAWHLQSRVLEKRERESERERERESDRERQAETDREID